MIRKDTSDIIERIRVQLRASVYLGPVCIGMLELASLLQQTDVVDYERCLSYGVQFTLPNELHSERTVDLAILVYSIERTFLRL